MDEPESVRLKRLWSSLGKMGQAGQYNFPRAKRRNDIGAMYFSLSEFVNAAVETAYLLNDIYMPFYKWKMRGMDEFGRVPQMRMLLQEVMEKEVTDKDLEEKIGRICGDVVRELKMQGLSDKDDEFLEVQKNEVFEKLISIEKEKGNE